MRMKTLIGTVLVLASLSLWAFGGKSHKEEEHEHHGKRGHHHKHGEHRRGHSVEHKVEKLTKKLDLTEEQIQKIKDYFEKNKKDKGRWKEKRAIKEQLHQAFIEGKSDSELRRLHNKMKAHKAQKHMRKIEKLIFLKSVLTKEQREKFIQMKRDKHMWNKK